MDAATLSTLGGIAVSASVLIGGLYALIRLVLKVGVWTNTVSRAIRENTSATKELSDRTDKISRQLDRYDHDITANRQRIERMEREHLERTWHDKNWPVP